MSEVVKVPATGQELEVIQRLLEATMRLYDLPVGAANALSDASDRIQEATLAHFGEAPEVTWGSGHGVARLRMYLEDLTDDNVILMYGPVLFGIMAEILGSDLDDVRESLGLLPGQPLVADEDEPAAWGGRNEDQAHFSGD